MRSVQASAEAQKIRAELMRVHQLTCARFPKETKEIIRGLKDIDWTLVSHFGRLHAARSGSSREFSVNADDVVFEHNPVSPRIFGYNFDTGLITCNLASQEVRNLLARHEGTPPTKQAVYNLLHAIMHETAHGSGWAEFERFSPPVDADQHAWVRRRAHFGYGAQDSLEVTTPYGDRRTEQVNHGHYWFEGMTEFVAFINTNEYLQQRHSFTFSGQRITAAEFPALNAAYTRNEKVGYTRAVRTILTIANAVARYTGFEPKLVYQSFVRGYYSQDGLRTLMDFLTSLKVPERILYESRRVHPHSGEARLMEHFLIQEVRRALTNQPEYVITFITGGIHHLGSGMSHATNTSR